MKDENKLLGRIPGSSGGIRKTYPESIIRIVDKNNIILATLRNSGNMEKLYLDKETNMLVIESELEKKDNYKELEILSVLPYGVYRQFKDDGRTEEKFLIEVIEKNILLEHLKEERKLLDEMIKGKSLSLSK